MHSSSIWKKMIFVSYSGRMSHTRETASATESVIYRVYFNFSCVVEFGIIVVELANTANEIEDSTSVAIVSLDKFHQPHPNMMHIADTWILFHSPIRIASSFSYQFSNSVNILGTTKANKSIIATTTSCLKSHE